MNAQGWFRDALSLTKVRITAMAAVTCASGYSLRARGLDSGVWPVLAGTFLVAMAAAIWNEIGEADLDARMVRTAGRPIPAGRLHPATAGWIAAIVAGLGFSSLASAPERPLWAIALAAFAMAYYNLVYTPLKRRTAFAVVPGALIGAIPPAIGWVAAGGGLGDPAVWLLGGYFFVWQVPHFWLLSLVHHDDYRRAGFPTLLDRFRPPQVARIVRAWVLATAVAAPLAAFGCGLPAWAVLALLLVSIALMVRGVSVAWAPTCAFRVINLHALGVALVFAIAA